jgi:hypothetical protein
MLTWLARMLEFVDGHDWEVRRGEDGPAIERTVGSNCPSSSQFGGAGHAHHRFNAI